MSTKQYQRDYYEENKSVISDLRKIRYHTDPAYREKVKRRSRARYRKNMKSPDKKLGYTIKVMDNMTLFSIKYVLGIIGKSRDFLEVWETRGHIPRSTYTDSRGWRLYSRHQIDLLDISIDKYDKKEWNREQVREYLNTKWDSEGN
jgi:hypothetical protein